MSSTEARSIVNMSLDLYVIEDDLKVELEDMVVDEELDDGQERWYKKLKDDYEDVVQQLENLQEVGEVVAKSDSTIAVQIGGDSVSPQTAAPNVSQTSVIKSTASSRNASQPGQQIQSSKRANSPKVHVQPVPILQNSNPMPGNVVPRPSGNGPQPPPPPGTYQLVMDPRVGGFFVGTVSAGIPNSGVPASVGPAYRAPVPAIPKASQLRTQSVSVPVTKNLLVTPTSGTSSVLLQRPMNKGAVWTPSAPTGSRTSTAVSNSIGSVIASTSSVPAGIPIRPHRGRPPRHALHNVATRPAVPAGPAAVTGLAIQDLMKRPAVNSYTNNNLKTFSFNDTRATLNYIPNTSPLNSAFIASPTVANTTMTSANQNSGVIISNSVGNLSRIIQPTITQLPPLTPISSKSSFVSRPQYSQIRPLPISNAVGLGLNMPANQIRPPAMTNQYRSAAPAAGIRTAASVNGPSPVNNGARSSSSINSTPVPADSREVNFNKLGVGKTFPSLVVLAKPTMRIKEFTPTTITKDRADLDQQVKELLLNSMTKLTEWLIQQGLVRSSQVCQTHRSATTGEPVNLKLGMYSDVSKFPHSGGYVWICEFCPTQLFISVFSGSIFEGAPHPPLVLLKLIYHWACQTTSSNVVSWVKVESFYVKVFFTHMRAICTAAVHENYELMGGPNKRVEVGVISLGTAAQDGSTRNVKVEVLGVMDPESKLIRLRAVEPLQDGEKNYKRRFVKILEPLAKWVHKKSIILTDFTVDKGTLHNMGFPTVYQVSVNPDSPHDKTPKFSNINVMNYLRKVVPRMFQNTLSLLSRQIIQQFLDELVWRERWGPMPSQAYNNIIKHIAEQTRVNTGSSFLRRLNKISDDPFRDWKYSVDEDVQVISDNIPKKSLTPIAPAPPLAGAAAATAASPAAGMTPASSNSLEPPPAPEILRPSIDMLPPGIRETEAELIPLGPAIRGKGRKRPAEPLPLPMERPRKRTADYIGPRKCTTPYSTLVIGTEQTTSLQAYYYGSLEGDPVAVSEERKEIPVLKCCVCVRKFNNNIQLMKHLILHTQISQFSSELSDVTQCKYCLKTFPTPFSMQTHLEEVHLTMGNNDICMICTEKFKDTSTLIGHMHRTHVALEMPYVCHVCQFRSSIHRDLIDHFYEVHNNGEKLQCPFCLKTVAVCANGRKLGSNVSFFLTHIQKHQRRSIVKKCTRCALWFVNKWAIREHLQRDHVSFKDVAGVKPTLPDTGEDIKMPLPPAELGPSATLSAIRRGANFPNRGCHSTTYLLPTLMLDDNIAEYSCIECNAEMSQSHYPGYSMCSRCRFATCCPKTMKDHMRTFHETYDESPVFDIGTPVHLAEPMHCVCGFSSNSGNRLAKHLALCDKKSAYPSATRAKAATVQSASFPPLVTLDDVDNNGEDPSDKWLKAFVPARREDSETSRDAAPEKKSTGADTHSMLNVLGLVRKPSTDESSLDKAPSDKEDSTETPVTASGSVSASVSANV